MHTRSCSLQPLKQLGESVRTSLRGVLLALPCFLAFGSVVTEVQAQCFSSMPVPGFSEEAIGGDVSGAARLADDVIEICSSSRGYGSTRDSIYSLAQDSATEFVLSVDVLGVDGLGQVGVEARAFRGTGSDPSQALVKISLEEGPVGFALVSGLRAEKFDALDSSGAQAVPVQLPLRIGIERSGDLLTTFYYQGAARIDHFSYQVGAGSGLDTSSYRVAIVHGADLTGQAQGPARMGTGRFRAPVLETQTSVNPPRLTPLIDNHQGTVDQPTILTIHGTRLADTEEVTVAGLQATIQERTETRLVVMVPATQEPLRGDIVVRSPGGTSELPNAFFSFGEAFIRCDCNGDGELDISDVIAMLQHLFSGGPACTCSEAGDCNDDDDQDLSDPISALSFLFSNEGDAPPAPFPEPGTDPRAPMCGLEDHMPSLTGVSQSRIAPGDEFFVTGTGFSESTRVVLPGARLEVLSVTPERITLRAGVIIGRGPVGLALIEDYHEPLLGPCRPRSCSTTAIGPLSQLEEPVELLPSSGIGVVGVSEAMADGAKIRIQLDPEMFDPNRPLEVNAFLASTPMANVSPGARATSFQMSPEKSFEDTVVRLADRLRFELAGGGDLGAVRVLPDRSRGSVVICPNEELPMEIALTGAFSVYVGDVGRCGPELTHPIVDERAHGWCRFTELVEPCNGLPQFEWFIPLSWVKSKSNSLAGLPNPSDRSPHDKEILYNWEAYCHVRRHRLWNLCALERLVDLGRTEIPDFPVGAWVTKTIWRTADEIPAGVDLTKLYSYVYSGDDETYYLTAIHHITKDIDQWFWYDLYPPVQILEGGKGDFVRGIGGCGGTNVDVPADFSDSIWANYFLCTNVTLSQPVSTSGIDGVGPTSTENSAWCGNFEFATECPDVIDAANLEPADDCFSGDDTCLRCHDENSLASVGGGTIAVDFLHSLKSAVPDPYPCDGEGGPVTYTTHIQPIINNNCSCHSWMEYSTLVDAPSGDVPTMDRVEPGDLNNSYMWRKINNTHSVLCDPPEDCGCAMPYDCSAAPVPLATWELDAIEEWILSGAPYD